MCTTMIFTKGACADGAMRVTHSDDNELSDQRMIYVPAQDHEPGSFRAVVAGTDDAYPRLVSTDRGPNYQLEGYPDTKAIGKIPQVEHTYAYFDGSYGIMNEHNLMFGECTNGAKFQPEYISQQDAQASGIQCRIFYSAELSRIALERCKTAREAVELMGKLIDEYGYFSTGETLLVGDEKEAWVFEMCALPDNTYHSVWAAQRIPDGELFVAANEFRIRILEEGNQDQLWSPLLKPGVEILGWWKEAEGPLDWLPTISQGEYAHPYYSLRRVWRVFDRANPDLGLSPWVNGGGYTTDYPFSAKPQHPLSRREIFALYRDHYEGTEFDLTEGIAAGPYGDPHRFTGPYDGAQNNISDEKLFGAWERSISVFYQGYITVCEVRPDAPELTKGVCWFGPDVAYTTCFAPFPAKMSNLPAAYQSGDPQVYSRDSAWWAFDFVANWSRLNFQRMCHADILPLQARLEQEGEQVLLAWDQCQDEDLTRLAEEHANHLLQCWWQLADKLVAKYSNGYINGSKQLPQNSHPVPVGYPSEWLGKTDYAKGPTSYDMKL
ncbi:dipeptidase [Vibrio quintilis]|uniref:Dipeptidase n=1 Tax=Vibrio quintilis TaxID=1117707 RepID=A0A1M7YS08_9VIBR|nr:C69 family dipeptidase [Vibrio quintilis]SHO55411.1 Dipeptidase [Vibrio quintilis]